MSLQPFHLAIPVYDVPLARAFYRDVFGLEEGRSAEAWVDFNFFGHQLVIHHHPKMPYQEDAGTNSVDGHNVPVPHFGVVLTWPQWEDLAEASQGCRNRLYYRTVYSFQRPSRRTSDYVFS